MRISGMASGMDIDQLVKDLMKAERQPLERLEQQKTWTQWQQEEYRNVNTKLLNLRNSTMNLRMSSTFMGRQATSSNENIFTARATGSAQAGSYNIEVEQMATSASAVTGEDINVAEAFGDFVNKEIRVSNGDKSEVITAESFEDFAKKIRQSDLGINVFHDENGGAVFTTEATGKNAEIKFEVMERNDDDELVVADGATNKFFQDLFGAETEFKGTNAKVKVNGLEIERESNTFQVDGTEITLNSAQKGQTVRLTVEHNVDQAVENIKNFVEEYNKVVADLNERLNEPRHRDFHPLSDDQRRAMSESEVEMWEEKAKSGMLRGSRTLQSVLTNMRMTMTSPILERDEANPDKLRTLSQIGIETGSYHERGILHLDEDKLREKLLEDPEGVAALFNTAEEGIGHTMRDDINAGIETLTDRAGRETNLYDQSTLSNEIRRFEDRMEQMENRLQMVESRYWSQFTAMEKALMQMNSQSDWLYQQTMAMMG
ncbi:flagellar hook-associated protein 2 [Desulfitispora alkaliphila]|uniref:flagellar filament capping protein FliD n=1 Tax=Desulfitispora alkaliphila TaxID=622674 RepID=UPI003D1966F7